jgi:hypothetical protein
VLATSGDLALQIVIVLAMIVPLAILGVICWIFLKAARRDAERDP